MDPGDPIGSSEFIVPMRVGEFSILGKLGEGGMAVVYDAEQQAPRRRVALKVVRGGPFVDDTTLRMFRREVQALALLRHPSIAALYESGRTDDGRPFFAMELVRGETLTAYAERVRGDALDVAGLRRLLTLFQGICGAVHYAHQRGVVHRDLKPSNILVPAGSPVPAGGPEPIPAVKILDFGLAKITDADLGAASFVTELGVVRGTLPYMSPEQLRGDPLEIDQSTDTYALGVVLYEMLTGRLPHDLERAPLHEAARIITEQPPVPIARSWKGARRLDDDVATIVHKALEKDPAERYSSAAAIAEDIQRFLSNQPILARPPSAAYQLRKLVARNRLAFGAAAAGVFLVLGFGVGMAVLARHVAAERDRANAEAARAGDEARTARLVSEALLQIVRGDRPDQNPGHTTLGPETLERMVERVGTELAGKPALRAKMLVEVATSLSSQGEYKLARKFLAEGISIGGEAGVPDVGAMQRARLDLGEIDLELGRWDDAEAVFSRYRDLALQEQGPKSAAYAYALEDLGCLRRDQGRFAEAGELLRRCRDVYATLSIPYTDLVASIQDSLGNLDLAEGRFGEAEAAHRKAMELRWSRVSISPSALRSLHYVGVCLVKLRRFDEAGELLRTALERREKVLGPDHPDVARTLQALAEIDIETRRLERSGPRLLRSRAILERQYDPGHPVLADQAFLEGRWEEAKGDRAAAESRYRQALAIRQGRWPAGHPTADAARAALARVLQGSGRDPETRLAESRALGTNASPHP